jgi:hypothetical protein
MIDENVKVHDQFSVELKVGFVARKKQKINDFAFNIWIFVPNSLDINRFTYTKNDFYKDFTSHIRLITPSYQPGNLADPSSHPFSSLEKSFHSLAKAPTKTNKENYENQLKMFLSILKSSLRDYVAHAISSESDHNRDTLIRSYTANVKKISVNYRALKRIINIPSIPGEMTDYFLFGDEFMSNIIELHTFRLMQLLQDNHPVLYGDMRSELMALIDYEISYKKDHGYLVVEENGNNHKNQALVFHLSMLKKYAESNLFLDIKKRKDGVWVEQILFSVAAGLSMIFATYIAFSVQQKFGNFTMPVFVALVVSYMLKDRIKELARYYFAHRLNKRYFDHKIKISTHNNEIGWVKESMDFISEQNVPDEIVKKRDRSSILEANNRASSERIILYRILMRLNKESIDANSEYPVSGVNEIFRLNISNYIQKMDSADFPLYYPDHNEGFKIVPGEKIYYLNMILQAREAEQWDYKRYRIIFNRKGIQKIESFG